MALRGAALERGAARAGVTPEAARRDPLANIRAAAALLDAFADEAAIDRSRNEQWSGVIARYSEIERPDGRAAYGREVDRALGGLPPQLARAPAPARTACLPPPPPGSGGAPDYPPGVWRASPNFNARPSDPTGRGHALFIPTGGANKPGGCSCPVIPS